MRAAESRRAAKRVPIGEIIVERNRHQVARILPGRGHQTALEAMAGLYRTLPDRAGANWLAESRDLPGVGDLADEARDPWAS